jgi:hypothetical protein
MTLIQINRHWSSDRGDAVMSVALNLLIVVAAVAFPFVMMPILWRRMRHVQRQVLHGQEKDSAPAFWEESDTRDGGLAVTRRGAPNEELIALGDRARHGRWPIDNA